VGGSSGSGESAIDGVLTRHYDADNKESICVDGKEPVSGYGQSELRRMVGQCITVSQEPTLLRGTIRDNIVYGQWGRYGLRRATLGGGKTRPGARVCQELSKGVTAYDGPAKGRTTQWRSAATSDWCTG
jgi:ABC-type phosphate/phosphonate transport system ATPase subunit